MGRCSMLVVVDGRSSGDSITRTRISLPKTMNVFFTGRLNTSLVLFLLSYALDGGLEMFSTRERVTHI